VRSLADFHRISVINLAHRTDRRAQMAEQLALVGLGLDSPNVRLFEAVRPDDAGGFESIGARGCFMSHLGVLQQAVGLGNVLILEDDLDFVAGVRALTVDALTALPADWDVFYGGVSIRDFGPGEGPLRAVDPATYFTAAHFVAFNGSVIPRLVEYLQAVLARPPGHPDGGPMHVDGAYARFRSEHPSTKVYVAVPELGYQRSSRSDIYALRWFDRLPLVREAVQVARRVMAAGRRLQQD
jgi:glycosyl transferase, family 25